MTGREVAFGWSGGKDSALALSLLLDRSDVHVDRLFTTVHPDRDSSTVHGIPTGLLRAQAASIGIGLQTVPLPGPGLEGYAEAMDKASRRMRSEGIDAVAFGDLACSGVLEHKRKQFEPLGLEVIEPLWELTSAQSAACFCDSGLRAVTVVVDAGALDSSYLGVEVDRALLERLPTGVDPSGELGEYHSFAYAGPIFTTPVEFALSPVRRLDRRIRTTEGLCTYSYWLATPAEPS